MNTATYTHPANAPAAVLERKIHDIEFFKSMSSISESDVRNYAAKHGLNFDEQRLQDALAAIPADYGTRLNRQLESLRRGEHAYPPSHVAEFAKEHRLPLSAADKALLARVTQEEKEEQLRLKDIEARQTLSNMLTRIENHLRNLPYSEEQVRAHATAHKLPLDEERMKALFKQPI